MRFIKKAFLWFFRELFSMYAPTFLTLLFAIVVIEFLPDWPLWLIPLFFVVVIIVFHHYVKW
jgi:hypothetical protein